MRLLCIRKNCHEDSNLCYGHSFCECRFVDMDDKEVAKVVKSIQDENPGLWYTWITQEINEKTDNA